MELEWECPILPNGKQFAIFNKSRPLVHSLYGLCGAVQSKQQDRCKC